MNALVTLLLASTIILNTNNSTMVLNAETGREAQILYYGAALGPNETAALEDAGFRASSLYPAFGLRGAAEPAVSMIQADGNLTLDLRVSEVSAQKWQNGEVLSITSCDPVCPVTVKNFFKTYEAENIIETWVEITNTGKKESTLTRYYSGHLPVRVGDVWLSTLYGTWANEGRVCEEPLARGLKLIKNMDGTRNSHTSHAEAMISLDGKPCENSGRVIGLALEWGGNYELRFQTNDSDFHHVFAGICPDNAPYTLAKGETFKSPALAYSYSGEGLSGVSRNFHRWGRKYRLAHGDIERKVLLNSWEGVYFDINEPGMDQMMGDIASMGGELFVMDDGWFGVKYPRKNDSSSLGDWEVDRTKLPGGIGALVKMADGHGIRFGIWIEPEMTNSVSELYEKHPEWVLKAPGRENVYGRGGTQLVLDMANPQVQDYVFGIVDGLLTQNPRIDYIKWDANMNISAYGSQYTKDQARLDVAYWDGFARTCDRIRAKYPDVTIQACASGGGRANWGVLPWFDEFWTSDNTDALQRIYMQWGTSYFFPAIAMASHISATPNHTVFRTTSLKFRCDVACSGRLGMEIQPKNMTDAEKDFCRKVIADYKGVRPVVQFGDIYRLTSPYDNKGFASMMYVTSEKDKAVFYWWKIANFYDQHFPRAVMAGLDPEKTYRVHELNRIDITPLPCEGKCFSGRFLMENGLDLPSSNNVDYNMKSDWSSRVLYLTVE
ncbi:MAG: alpha-galactosidase [Bacteroidales bacterium]|nr:alpha-galactosidase [Bacteroidales bacterium]